MGATPPLDEFDGRYASLACLIAAGVIREHGQRAACEEPTLRPSERAVVCKHLAVLEYRLMLHAAAQAELKAPPRRTGSEAEAGP